MLRYYRLETGKIVEASNTDNPFDFGKTVPGEQNKLQLIVENSYADPVELVPYVKAYNPKSTQYDLPEPDFHFIKFPKYLLPKEKADIEVNFAPAKERRQPLNAQWGFEVVIG